MADPSTPDVDEGQEPPADEGQEPGGVNDPEGQEPKGRSYTEAYVKQLRRENAALRSRATDAEEALQERNDAEKTELEREREQRVAEAARADSLELRILRYEVATEAGLEPAAIKFLTGTTREELELHADELKQLLREQAKPTAAGFDGGARTPPTTKGTPEEEHNKLLMDALGRPRTAR